MTDKKHHSESNISPLEKLYLFMGKYRTESTKKKGDNLPFTHANTHTPYGKFNIPDDMSNRFHELYVDAVCAGYQPHIVEKHKEYGPILLDFDFVQSGDKPKRYYTTKIIQTLVKEYNRLIYKYLDVKAKFMDAYISEKSAPALRNGEYHDGIHVIYPYICTRHGLQEAMREEFIEIIRELDVFKDIPHNNSLEKVVDKSVIYSNGFMMYLSRKNTSYKAYELTHVYCPSNKNLYDSFIPSDLKLTNRKLIHHLVTITSIRRFSERDIMKLNENVDPLVVDSKINAIKVKLQDKFKDRKLGDVHSDNENFSNYIGDSHFIKAVPDDVLADTRNILSLLSKDRAFNYDEWYKVGQCLNNIDYRLLPDWIRFSKKCPEKFKKGECETLWRKMRESNYSVATLHYFAAEDSPAKYIELKKSKISKLLDDGIQTSHNTIAKLVIEKYKYKFRCACIKQGLWYEYKNHRWIENPGGYSIRILISDELSKEYREKRSLLFSEAGEYEGKKQKIVLEEAAQISKILGNLHDNRFKKSVVSECADYAFDPNFLRNIDENIYLIGFDNGVYDLENDVFREGCPDDYISLTTGYSYVPFNKDDETAIEIEEFLNKIQTDKEMREYLMLLLSTCLSGSITEESFYVFTGSGANGKSKLMELLKYTLGEYFKPMDIRLLTEKRSSSSSASPEVADKKGIRACPFDEPKSNDEINTGFMKIFTGGDTITARALFKEPIYFKPQFKPFLLCNHLPNINSDDDGTWRRLCVIPFLSKFIKPSDTEQIAKKATWPSNYFMADGDLSNKLKSWRQTFMGMLISYYRKYKEDGLVHPKLVRQHTVNYRRRCDIFQDFINDYLEKADDSSFITLGKLYENLRTWHKSNYNGSCPNKKDLKTYLLTRTENYVEKSESLKGYKLKDFNEEDKEGEFNDEQ
uniref:SF3 helicase domain-containing protein n=1 Tax=viral metagenome TaxID=1070528 RepID=A0A6C0CBX0_9ZZZZ